MPRAKNQTPKRNLAELYNQLLAVMPLLEEIVQPEEVREAGQPYAPTAGASPEAGLRYHFEKRGREAWAVLDSRDGETLVVLAKYKKGAAALVERLEAYERRIAELSPAQPPPKKSEAFRSLMLR